MRVRRWEFGGGFLDSDSQSYIGTLRACSHLEEVHVEAEVVGGVLVCLQRLALQHLEQLHAGYGWV